MMHTYCTTSGTTCVSFFFNEKAYFNVQCLTPIAEENGIFE